MYSLNTKQAEGLANFFFDIAKGLILGGVGSVAVSPVQIKFISGTLSGVFAYICIKIALTILEGSDK